MASKKLFEIIGIIVAIILTGVGLWGAYFYRDTSLWLNNIFSDLVLIDYSNWLLLGLLVGFGTIFGDLMGSFVKRRLNYEPGKPFIPFDQLDAVVGTLIFIYPLVRLSLNKIIIIVVLSFVLHITISRLAFFLKIRKEKW